MVEESAPTQTDEETAHSLKANAVRALATPGYSFPVNGRNVDTHGLLRASSLKEEQCDIFAQSKNCGARETAVVK
jgi:hypothetical protein